VILFTYNPNISVLYPISCTNHEFVVIFVFFRLISGPKNITVFEIILCNHLIKEEEDEQLEVQKRDRPCIGIGGGGRILTPRLSLQLGQTACRESDGG
jgi:hypothetical protein